MPKKSNLNRLKEILEEELERIPHLKDLAVHQKNLEEWVRMDEVDNVVSWVLEKIEDVEFGD